MQKDTWCASGRTILRAGYRSPFMRLPPSRSYPSSVLSLVPVFYHMRSVNGSLHVDFFVNRLVWCMQPRRAQVCVWQGWRMVIGQHRPPWGHSACPGGFRRAARCGNTDELSSCLRFILFYFLWFICRALAGAMRIQQRPPRCLRVSYSSLMCACHISV